MKKFFEQYGGVALGILAILVLIAMITPVGNIIKTSLQGTVTKFSGSMSGQLDDAMNATATAQNNASGLEVNFSPNPEPENPVVPGTPTPSPETGTPVVPPVEPVTPENYDGYITEPGKYFINLICENKNQISGGAIPAPFCLDYEIKVFVTKKNAVTGEPEGSEKVINYTSYSGPESSVSLNTTNFTLSLGSWTGWLNAAKSGYDKTGGDSEMVTFDITQEMLDEANGKIYLDWSFQADMYPGVPIEELGQPLRVRVGKIEADDSQIILKCSPYNGASCS